MRKKLIAIILLFFFVFYPVIAAAPGLARSAGAIWDLGEASGTRYDSVTQGVGPAAQFTRSNSEYLNIADNASLSTGDIDFSFAAFVYLDTLGSAGQQRMIAGKGGGVGATREWSLRYDTDSARFRFFISGNGSAAAAIVNADNFGAPSATTWYFIVCGYDSVNGKTFISVNNGTVNTTATSGTAPADRAGAFTLGIEDGATDTYWDGRMQLAGFWKKVLSASEITSLYNSGKGLAYRDLSSGLKTSLQAYWNLNEGSGTRYDSAGANNLTDNNTVTQATGVRGDNSLGDNATVTQAAGPYRSAIAGQFTSANTEMLSIPDNAALSVGGTDFSITAWVYFDSLPSTDGSSAAILGKLSTGTEYQLRARNDAGTKRIQFRVVDTILSASTFGTPNTGVWYFIYASFTNSSNTLKISIDNGTADSTTGTAPSDTTEPFCIGGQCLAVIPHDGRISKVGFWKKVLSATEITDLYNSGRGNSYDGAAFYKDTAGTLATSLQAWWELDELCCTRFDKVSPGVGPAAQFTAANSESLSIADNAALSTGDIDFTTAAWVYLDSGGTDRYIVNKSKNANDEFNLFYRNSTPRFRFVLAGAVGVDADNFGSVSTGTWYYVVAWHDSVADTINIQVNGGAVNLSNTSGTAPTDGTAKFEIGSANEGTTNFWNGRIQNVGFWKRVLTADERTSLYNSGSGRNCKDLNDQLRRKLISYWNLNEGSGTRYDCVGANDLTDNATVTQATGVAGGNSLGDNATVTHQQGLPWWTKARASGQFTAANSEYLSIASNSDLSPGDQNFSFAGWVYFTDIGTDRTIIQKIGTNVGYNLNRETNNTIRWIVGDGTSNNIVSTSATVSANTWHFIFAYFNTTANEIGVSLDNGTVVTTAMTTAANTGTDEFRMGIRNAGTFPLDGRMDEWGLWQKRLSAQEVTDLYNSGKANRYNGNSFEVDTSGTLATSLTAYWTLDEASGIRYDSKGANHLTDNNTVTQNVGIDGTAAGQFTAANSEYLSIPDNAALSWPTTDDATVAAWFYFDDQPGTRYIYEKDGNEIVSVSGEVGFQITGGIGPARTAVTNNAWHFIIGWFDYVDGTNNTVSYQINGGSITTITTTGEPSDGTVALNIGAKVGASFWNGRIDQVMFFKRVLTESERAQLYNEGIGQGYQNLQREFRKRSFY